MFPAPPSLHRVPRIRFPCFVGTTRRSDLPTAVPRALRLGLAAGHRDLPGSRRTLLRACVLSDSGGPCRPRHCGRRDAAFQHIEAVSATIGLSLSELNHTAHLLAVYASRFGLPRTAQDSLPACWLRFDRAVSRRVPLKRLRVSSLSPSSRAGLSLAHQY